MLLSHATGVNQPLKIETIRKKMLVLCPILGRWGSLRCGPPRLGPKAGAELSGLSRKFGDVIHDGLEPGKQELLAIVFM
jgi:hypothetical protein